MKKLHLVILGLALICSAVSVSLKTENLAEKPIATSSVASKPYLVTEKCFMRKPFALEIGDEVLSVNGKPFTGPYEDLQFLHDELKSKNNLTLEVRRRGEKLSVTRTYEQLEELRTSTGS